MHLFFAKGLNGGVSQIGTPWTEANHESIKEKLREEYMRSYIVMLDCNNQYGWSMSQYLPTHGFKWVELETNSLEF